MSKLKIEYIDIDKLIPYINNPRDNKNAVDKVAASIKEFGFKNPIIVDKENVIVAGHTRLLASRKLDLKEVPIIRVDDLTDKQIKAFRIADNKTSEFAEWDFDLLGEELDDLLLFDIDMADFGFEEHLNIIKQEINNRNKGESLSLIDIFGIPPFSIFDTRQGYWQDRKREWKSLGIKSELGRSDNLMNAPDLPQYYTQSTLKGFAPQTSIFDPVVCEIIYKWFNIEKGKILDPFAGGSVRGIVAAKLGFDYTGIDLSSEQIEANKNNAKELDVNPNWFCDDSLNVDKYVKDESQDLIFSCPPYADLEKYSDDERDLSNMEYEDFRKVYFEIIKKCVKKLKNNRFACFVVGDVRDKDGFYYNFIDDTKKAFLDAGLRFYNDIVLVENVGTAALRAKKTFKSMRKVIKTHQNVLVFYKGNPKEIKNNYKSIQFDDNTKFLLEEM